MDAHGLHLNIDYLGCSGIILSPEQKAALQSSLVVLQHENKFSRVYFWGKILGMREDYFIARGVTGDEFRPKKTFYSKDCTLWALLPPATEMLRSQCQVVKGRFTGDPSFDYEHVITKKVGEGEEATTEEETMVVKEENRLTSLISDIENDVWIVPRGAYIKLPTGEVCVNRNFEGLSVPEAGKLGNYMHFREPMLLTLKSLLQRADLDKAIDFMDTAAEDIPRGTWSLQYERGSGLVVMRSLQWPGYVFYHVPATRLYGSAYFGTGDKNLDLPFML